MHDLKSSSHAYHLLVTGPDKLFIFRKDQLEEPRGILLIPQRPLWIHLDDTSSIFYLVTKDGIIHQYKMTHTFKLINRRRISEVPLRNVTE